MAVSLPLLATAVLFVYSRTGQSQPMYQLNQTEVMRHFIHKIFDKYGNGGQMSFEGFEHLLHSLGLAQIAITDHNVEAHYKDRKFIDFHRNHSHAPSETTEKKHGHNHGQLNASPTEERHKKSHKNHKYIQHQRRRKNKMPLLSETNDDVTSGESERNTKPTATTTTATKHLARKARNIDIGDHECLGASDLLAAFGMVSQPIDEARFMELCPAIVSQLDAQACTSAAAEPDDVADVTSASVFSFLSIPPKVWIMATAAVTIISLVGLFCVALIPIMHRYFFNYMLQFFVSLAVGSLTGDAFLHLIPHAFMDKHGDDSSGVDEKAYIWRGFVALGGMFLFFVAERIVAINALIRTRREEHEMQVYRETHYCVDSADIGEKLSNYDASCFSKEEMLVVLQKSKDSPEMEEELARITKADNRATGKSSSGHSHQVPTSVSAMAWMVIAGDGLHNFTDGLAIGAAFASSMTVGLSTTIAVFCHELPHELGDFAVLLQAGMRVKQALFYNLVSSLLCFIGMLIGICLGNLESASQWIFVAAAGMFVYIALVDMVPEMSNAYNADNKSVGWGLFFLHVSGIMIGSGIMLTIALYEEKIVFNLPENFL